MTEAIWFRPEVVYPQPFTSVLIWFGDRMYVGYKGLGDHWYSIRPGHDVANDFLAYEITAWTPLPNAPLTSEAFGG